MKVGTRVEMHPATDEWMRGDRFGTVERVERTVRLAGDPQRVFVRMDRSGRLIRFHPDNVTEVE